MVKTYITATIVAAAVAGEGLVDQPGTLTNIIERFGLAAGLLLFFIWRDYCNQKDAKNREKALVLRINAVEDDRSDMQKKVIEENTKALDKVATVIDRCHQRTPSTDSLVRTRDHG